MAELRIATRRSRLALAQAGRIADLLTQTHPVLLVRLVEVSTSGDREGRRPITGLSEVGAFVRSVQQAVIEDRADLAVHSLKDLPLTGPPNLTLAALPERGSPFDVLVGAGLDDLTPGALVGTGSPRRVAQLLELRPDLRTVPLRGNVDTRLDRVAAGEIAAAILAEAALERLGETDKVMHRFDPAEMVPAPGQGALAVEALAGSPAAVLAGAIDDGPLRTLLSAERTLMAETAAGCRSALGALATWEADRLRLEVFVADERGPRRTVVTGEGPDDTVALARKGLGL